MGLIDKELALAYLEHATDVQNCIERITGLPSLEIPNITQFKFKNKSDLTEEERIKYATMLEDGEKPPCLFACKLPSHEQEIIVFTPTDVWKTIFYNDLDYGCFIDEGNIITEDMAWMALPKVMQRKL